MTTLSMWTIYDHPSDFPDSFVARRFDTGDGGPRPTDDVITSKSLDRLRNEMVLRGLTMIHRMPDDDAKIMEVWL